MKILRSIILYGVLTFSLVLLWQKVLRSPCYRVIEYDIGAFDERFLISREVFINQIEFAEIPWEEASETNLFRYVDGADFKVNLIWSDEQDRLYKGNDLENKLDNKQDSIDTVQNRYQTAVNRYEPVVREYESRLEQYEVDVTYWNDQGGAPEAEYNNLQNEVASLERKASELNSLLDTVNSLADENNQKVQTYNQNVAEYNNLFSTGHEFDAGNTDGTEINVYSYDGIQELRTLLVHEFGHVLGIDHVEDINSVMYYLLNDQNQKGTLSDVDVAALELSCRL
jgi:uncharacterized protein YoxC